MIKTVQISERHNALKFQLEGQTFLRIYNAQRKLITSYTGSDFTGLTFFGNPGAYSLESDGKVLEGQSVLMEAPNNRSVEVLHYFFGREQVLLEVLINREFHGRSPKELVDNKLLTLEELKTALIAWFEQQSVQQRARLIPDYKIIYALMDVYDAATEISIKATVRKFQSEFVKAERQIKSAKSIEEILAVRPEFPAELLGSVKKSALAPPKTKK